MSANLNCIKQTDIRTVILEYDWLIILCFASWGRGMSKSATFIKNQFWSCPLWGVLPSKFCDSRVAKYAPGPSWYLSHDHFQSFVMCGICMYLQSESMHTIQYFKLPLNSWTFKIVLGCWINFDGCSLLISYLQHITTHTVCTHHAYNPHKKNLYGSFSALKIFAIEIMEFHTWHNATINSGKLWP